MLSLICRFSLTNANSHQILSHYPVRKFNLDLTACSVFHFRTQLDSRKSSFFSSKSPEFAYISDQRSHNDRYISVMTGGDTLFNISTLYRSIPLACEIRNFSFVNKDRFHQSVWMTPAQVTIVLNRLLTILLFKQKKKAFKKAQKILCLTMIVKAYLLIIWVQI